MNIKIILAVIRLSVTTSLFAQSKSEDIDLKNIKHFYDRLKEYKIDTKKELVWLYTYGDTSQTRLNTLATALEKEGLQKVDIKKDMYKPKKYLLTVSEVKTYKPEALNERMHYLNEIAKQNNVMDNLAVFNANRPKKEENIDQYKKVND